MKFIQLSILIVWLLMCIYFIPYSIKYRNYKSLKFVTIALMLQNFMSLFASNTLPGYMSQFLILYKEIILWGVVLFTCLEKRKINKNSIPVLLFMGYLVICLFTGKAGLYTKLVCFRQIMTPVILILYGRSLKLDIEEKKSYISFIVDIGIFQAIFGLVERYILGDEFWRALNAENIFITKGFSNWVFGGLPGNYYSADLYHIIGRSIRRLVGITTDPLLTAHYLALCIILLLFVKLNQSTIKKYTELTLLTVACLLTLSKGAILIIGIAYIYKIWVHNKVVAIGFMGAAGAVIIAIIQSNLLRTVAIHLSGFTTVLSRITLFGGGIGTAGNLASLGGSSSVSGESYFGMILGQTGCVGLILFIWVILRMCKLVLRIDKSMHEYAIVAYVLAVMAEAIVSESAINFVGSGCAFIMLGLYTIVSCTRGKQV